MEGGFREIVRASLPMAAQDFVFAFRPNADSLASLYGAHLYLVGSALTSEHPGDMDVRIRLCGEDWLRLFGRLLPPEEGQVHARQWWNVNRESLKQSRRMTRRYDFRWRIDLQFQIDGVFDSHPGPKYQLDTALDHILDAGFGEP
jgi:hypothetical protein